MYCELLGYKKNSEKVYICNSEMQISREYNIGELFTSFMDLDFSSYSKFYNDMEPIFKTSYDYNGAGDEIKTFSLDKRRLTSFFNKYPLLKKEIIKDLVATKKRIYKDLCNFNFDFSIIEPVFNVASPPKTLDILELERILGGLEQANECELLIGSLKDDLSDIREFNRLTWKFIFEYDNPYISNLCELLDHPYFKLSNDDDSDYDITNQFNPHILQEQYREAFVFCFDVDFCHLLNNLSAEKRLYLYNNLHTCNHINFEDIKTEFITQSLDNKQAFDIEYKDLVAEESCFLDWFKNHISHELVQQVENLSVGRFQLYETYHLRNIMAIEFHQMIEHNIKVKKCKNCGHYFILKGDYATDYCDRIAPGEKFTCKKIAAINARKQKIQNNPIIKEYERAYKRYYARVSNHKMPKEDFRKWTEEAIKKRDMFSAKYEASPSDQLISEFKKYLGNK